MDDKHEGKSDTEEGVKEEVGPSGTNHSHDLIITVEKKPWHSFMMITTMFIIISSLRMVYSTIASFLPHYISLK
jgi:hypothetical protein